MTTEPERDPLDVAFDALRSEPIPNRPPDTELLARLAAGPSPAAEPVTLSRRRIIMRIATWSLAASVLVAVGVGLLFNGSAHVALADVVKAAERHKLVKYKYTATTTIATPPGVIADPPDATIDMVMYADLRTPRFRTEFPEADRGFFRPYGYTGLPEAHRGFFRTSGYAVNDYARNRILTVYDNRLVKEKEGDLKESGVDLNQLDWIEGKGAILTTIPTVPGNRFNFGPKRTVLDELRQLETHKDAKVDKEDKLLRYTIVDGKTTTTLWVDAATKLPVRMAIEEEEPIEGVARDRLEFSAFEWDPPLKGFKTLDDLFSLTPPDGYKLEDRTKEPAGKAAAAQKP
jgi:hypothetical protein